MTPAERIELLERQIAQLQEQVEGLMRLEVIPTVEYASFHWITAND